MNKVVGLLLTCFLLTGCGGDKDDCLGPENGCKPNYTQGHDGIDYDLLVDANGKTGCLGPESGCSEGKDESSSGGSDTPSTSGIDYSFVGTLDCNDLDPAKVYVHGHFSRTNGISSFIFDPETSQYCRGFPYFFDGASLVMGVVTSAGQYIYGYINDSTVTIYQHVADETPISTKYDYGEAYNQLVVSNDVALHSESACSGINILMAVPNTSEILYKACGLKNAIYPFGNELAGEFDAVLDTGGLVILGSDAIKVADGDGGDITEFPLPAGYNAQMYPLSAGAIRLTSGGGLQVASGLGLMAQRLSFDGLEVTLDGAYSPMPGGEWQIWGSKINGNGDLIQLVWDGDTIVSVIKRTIGGRTTILHTDGYVAGVAEAYDDEGSQVMSRGLITGP